MRLCSNDDNQLATAVCEHLQALHNSLGQKCGQARRHLNGGRRPDQVQRVQDHGHDGDEQLHKHAQAVRAVAGTDWSLRLLLF